MQRKKCFKIKQNKLLLLGILGIKIMPVEIFFSIKYQFDSCRRFR